MFRNHIPAFALLLLLTACGQKEAAAPAARPPVEVSVHTVGTESVTLTTELPGRIHPVREAQVRARATGILLERHFEEGADVEEGDLLFQIDPAPLQAALNSAEAEQARTEAALKESQARVNRYRELVEINAISQQVFEQAAAELAQHEAQLLADKAAVETARLNLGYTRVTAPISGRIGKALVTEGALVSAAEATKLAVIRQLDPVYLDIAQSSAEVLRLRRAAERGALGNVSPEEAPIKLLLEDAIVYDHPGKLLFSDISVDPNTGMITLRALVPNPENFLLPGMFARAQIVQGVISNAVTIPQRTVMRGPAGSVSVLLVNGESTVESRPIQINREIEGKVIVASGLRPGDQIIVEGSQKAPPGSAVTTVPFIPPAGRAGIASADTASN